MKEENRKSRASGLGNTFRQLFMGANNVHTSVMDEEQMQSPFRTIVRNFLSNKIAMTGLIVFLFILLSCFILAAIFNLDTSFQDVTQQNISPGFNMLSVPNNLKKNAKQIDVGATYSIGVDNDGKVYLWGKMDPKLKQIPEDMGKIAQVSAGQNHVLALSEDNKVYTWGNNRFTLDKIPSEVNRLGKIKQVEAGYQVSVVLSEDGKMVSWGNENLLDISLKEYQGTIDKLVSNGTTVLGLTKNGEVVAMATKPSPFSRIPEEIQGHVVDLESADTAAIALTDDGMIHVWGNAQYGLNVLPEELKGHKIKDIAAGRYHFVAVTDEGKVYSWGRNNYHQADVPTSLDKTKIAVVYSGTYQNYAVDENGKVTTWGLNGYLMGTDGLGRDVFSRLVTGGRMTLTIGAIAVIISTLIGIIVGGFSGYYGGKIDNLLMRFAEIVGSIPFLPLAMILSALLGNKVSELGRISMIMVILGVLSWPGLARLVRGQILAEREKEFVTAAKAMGIRELTIIFRHIIPNVLTVVIVNATLNFASALLTESALSFLGFGVVEPNPTWGNMLTGSQSSTVISDYWWRWVFPSIALSFATISINLIGDGLRDAIDPKSAER